MTHELKLRILTALVFAFIAVFTLWISKTCFLGFSCLVLLLASREWLNLLSIEQHIWKAGYLVIYCLGFMMPWFFQVHEILLFLSPLSLILAVFILCNMLCPHQFHSEKFTVLFTCTSFLLMWLCWYAVLLIIQLFDIKGLFFLLFVVILSDTVAYFSGKALGRNKLAPHISPSKTIEGAFCAVVVCTGLGAFYPLTPLLSGWMWCLVVTVVIVSGIIGDLTISVVKRRCGVKDTGNLLPGHGGILDRIDSFLVALPIFAYCMLLLGR